MVRHLRRLGRAERSPTWACYHSDLWTTELAGAPLGIVGGAIGAPFAVLVAEELFASGCELLISITSAGQIAADLDLPATVLIERALRGDGTSFAYLPPAPFVEADPRVLAAVAEGLAGAGVPVRQGAAWTTDAPFRETAAAIGQAAALGVLAVEMEAAGLYAFARARGRPVVCFALVTNRMAQIDGDFEKGPADGAERALDVAAAVIEAWWARR